MNSNNGRYEIGSHFWLDNCCVDKMKQEFNWFFDSEDGVFTFSGRTAIAIAIRDAIQTRKIEKAYLPSYCCSSMVQPFIDNGISYEFYDVDFNGNEIEYHIDREKETDIVLIMMYFGAKIKEYDSLIFSMQSKGCIVIEDVTHILLSESICNRRADYCIASLRKWFPIPSGGLVLKKRGKLQIKPVIDSNQCISEKIRAMHEKYDYLSGKSKDKESYLQKFDLFENSLNRFDSMLKIDSISQRLLESIDLDSIKFKRKRNASILYNRLIGVGGLRFLNADFISGKDIPLFVPIMLPTKMRNELREYLIARKIYCPIHWPAVEGTASGIRSNELSLICDQRYDETDMNYMADLIIDWFNNNSEH